MLLVNGMCLLCMLTWSTPNKTSSIESIRLIYLKREVFGFEQSNTQKRDKPFTFALILGDEWSGYNSFSLKLKT